MKNEFDIGGYNKARHGKKNDETSPGPIQYPEKTCQICQCCLFCNNPIKTKMWDCVRVSCASPVVQPEKIILE